MREQIDPKTLAKHSDIVNKNLKPATIVGNRTQTTTGYTVPGTRCRDFETAYIYMATNQVAEKHVHPSKYRTYRVLAGQGVATLFKDDQVRAVNLLAGDEIAMAPGITYQLSSTYNTSLELFVTQAPGYEKDLATLEDAQTEAAIPEEMLAPVSRADALQAHIQDTSIKPRRRKSKAAMQQAQLAVTRGHSQPAPGANANQDPAVAINLRPMSAADLAALG